MIPKMGYPGRRIRETKYSLLQLITQDNIAGKRGADRPQISQFQNIKEWTGIKSPNWLKTSELYPA